MDIKNLGDDEMLDYLMNSDYNEEEFRVSDYIYMLNKFKYFYRLYKGRSENKYSIYDLNARNQSDIILDCNNKNAKLQLELDKAKYIIEDLKNRKLSIRERFYGKIITKEDEN